MTSGPWEHRGRHRLTSLEIMRRCGFVVEIAARAGSLRSQSMPGAGSLTN